MPIRFRIDPSTRIVHAIGEEPLTDEDLRQYQLDLAAHPDHAAGFHQLVDLTKVSGLRVTGVGVRMAGHFTELFAEYVRGTRCAVVVASRIAYGLARMFEAHSSAAVDIRVFDDLALAEDWLEAAWRVQR